MPSALSIACGVETDAPLDRWNFLFPFRSFYAGFCRGVFSAAAVPHHLHSCDNNHRQCNVNRELQLLLERMSKNRKDLEDLEKEWQHSQLIPLTPPPPQPQPEQPQQQRPAVRTCDMGVQTQEDGRLLVYQLLLEDKIEQFKEQELMIERLQEHLAIVKEQLAEALEAAAAAATTAPSTMTTDS